MELIHQQVSFLVSNVLEIVIHQNHLPLVSRNVYHVHLTCLHTNLLLQTKIFAEVLILYHNSYTRDNIFNVTAKCPPGQYSETGLAPCSPCPPNYYQAGSGQTMCLGCPTNTKTKGPGAAGRDECQSIVCTESSCLHGGLCVPLGHGIQCFCPAGFSGKRCEIDIDECASQPCFNGGSCIDLPQGYRCQCKNGFSGINCQEEKSDCRNDTCPERAMCKDEPGLGNFTCLCRSGYTGQNCDMTVSYKKKKLMT